jgi:hypothetical protein
METDGRGDDDSACFGSVNEAADLVRWGRDRGDDGELTGDEG